MGVEVFTQPAVLSLSLSFPLSFSLSLSLYLRGARPVEDTEVVPGIPPWSLQLTGGPASYRTRPGSAPLFRDFFQED